MNTYPFENLFSYLAREYGHRDFTKEELTLARWPIPVKYLTASGLRAKRGRVYAMADLISYARLHAIAGEGIYQKKILRPSKILGLEKDTDGKIKVVHIAAGWIRPPFDMGNRENYGQLTFLCPFCGNLHFHGAGGPYFGDGDGDRIPHCLDHENPAFMRRDIQPLASQLAETWRISLTETEHFDLLGDMPAIIKKRLGHRKAERATA